MVVSVLHSLTACVAIYYLSLRRFYGKLLVVPMFDDLAERQRVSELEAFRAESAARAEAEAERDFYAAMMKSINRNSHSLIHVKDLEGRYLMLNEAFERAFGVAEADLLGQTDDVLDSVNVPRWRANDLQARDGVVRLEEYTDGEDGLHVFDSAKFPVYDQNGNLNGTCGISLDVTEVKRAHAELAEARDAALAATAAKSTFLATMSHEIRTPMNAVIGMADLLLDTKLDDSQLECLQTVRSSGDALLRVINDILDFSKIESGELSIASVPFDLREKIEGCLDLVMTGAVAKGLDVVCYVEDSCPVSAVGDPGRIRQILINLLANAVKFTAHGEVLLSVTAEPATEGRLRLTMVVTDTGIGISADGVRQLFKSFSQVDTSVTRVRGGTGLGLVISQRLARAMGGDVTVTSAWGVGSTFTVTVLLEPAAADVGQQRLEPDEALVGLNALVVNDSATTVRILDLQLARLGMTCAIAASADEALALIAGGLHYDLAIVDRQLPGADGLQLAESLRWGQGGRGQGESPVPIILLSPLGIRPSGASEQAVVILAKPVKSGALREALSSALQQRHEPRESDQVESPAQLPAAQPLRVLLAEDNLVNQRVAQLMLDRLGHVVDTVNNGRSAVEAVSRVAYDVVLMDVQMPELDGLEATRKIRARLSAEQQPHIVAMTANAMVEDRDACLAAGMESYLTKPVRVAELEAMLNRISATIRHRPAIQRTPPIPPLPILLDPVPLDALPLPVPPPQAADLDQLSQQVEGSDGLLGQLLVRHITRRTVSVAELGEALTTGDATRVRAITTTWNTTSALLGATALATLLEQAKGLVCLQADLHPSLSAQIEQEYASVSASLHRLQPPATAATAATDEQIAEEGDR